MQEDMLLEAKFPTQSVSADATFRSSICDRSRKNKDTEQEKNLLHLPNMFSNALQGDV